jgi:hypothetical protein
VIIREDGTILNADAVVLSEPDNYSHQRIVEYAASIASHIRRQKVAAADVTVAIWADRGTPYSVLEGVFQAFVRTNRAPSRFTLIGRSDQSSKPVGVELQVVSSPTDGKVTTLRFLDGSASKYEIDGAGPYESAEARSMLEGAVGRGPLAVSFARSTSIGDVVEFLIDCPDARRLAISLRDD